MSEQLGSSLDYAEFQCLWLKGRGKDLKREWQNRFLSMCVCAERPENEYMRAEIVRQCAHAKVIASEAEMKFRQIRSHEFWVAADNQKRWKGGMGGEKGEKKDSQWKLREREKEREGKKRAHTSGAVTSRCSDDGEGRLRAWSRERSHCLILRHFPLPN